MELGKAEKIAAKWLRANKLHYRKAALVGSIRRRDPVVRDIDILLIPRSPQINKRLIFPFAGYNVNIWYTTPENWGAALIWWTGGKGHNIGLARMAKKKGMIFSQYGVRGRITGKWLGGRTEQEVAIWLGWTWKPPEERGP